MEPPGYPLDNYQRHCVKIIEGRFEKPTEKQFSCWCIVCVSFLQYLISGIHREYRAHQRYFRNQNDVGIESWPGGHFCRPKSFHLKNVPSEEHNNAGEQNGDSEKFKHVHQHIVEVSKKGSKDPVSSGKAIDNKLQNFQVNYQKTDVDKQVEYCRNDPFKHFLLPKSYEHHVPKSLGWTVGNFFVFTQVYVGSDLQNPFSNKIGGDDESNRKGYLL